MRRLQELSGLIRAKHIFYVIDACFSGILLETENLAQAIPRGALSPYDTLTTLPVRQVLTAGSAGEQVFESKGHGLFTNVLLTGLEGEADLNQDGFITASELNQFVSPRVMRVSRNRQEPGFWQTRGWGWRNRLSIPAIATREDIMDPFHSDLRGGRLRVLLLYVSALMLPALASPSHASSPLTHLRIAVGEPLAVIGVQLGEGKLSRRDQRRLQQRRIGFGLELYGGRGTLQHRPISAY